MKVIQITYNAFGVNTYLVIDPATRECAIVDPGMSDPSELSDFKKAIAQNNLIPTHLINTHLHIDHVFGNAAIAEEYSLEVEANPADAILGERVQDQARMFGLPLDVKTVQIKRELKQGDIIKIGAGELKVLQVPGHSPGSIALYDAQDGFVITGDALFKGSIGRADLAGGDFSTLISAIKRELLTLPPETVVYPGHGPATTIGAEIEDNPFL